MPLKRAISESMQRIHRQRQPQHQQRQRQQQQRSSEFMEFPVPSYPQAVRQRRKKRSKRRSKQPQQKQRSNSSSSDDAQRRKSDSRSKNPPILEETPKILLWHSSEETRVEEPHTSSADAIFRQQNVGRQGPDEEPIALLGPHGPKWLEWGYWKERLSLRCCVPKDSSRQPRKPLIDYRPSYLGRYDDDFYHDYNDSTWGVPGLQQHYYVLPWPPPQVSPLTDADIPFTFSPTQNEKESNDLHPTAEHAPRTISSNNKNKAGKRKKHHKKNSSLLGTHYELPGPEPKEELPPIMDLQSVSSLESVQNSNNWKTPVKHHATLLIPDTNTTEGTNNSPSSNRIKGMRMSNSRTGSSPRNLPPVPPRRSKHKSQITNSTIASTALPPLPSPISCTNSNPAARDLTLSFSEASAITTGSRHQSFSEASANTSGSRHRSFSEASGNTTGSRHRRGGTVTEFSFESSASRPRNSSERCSNLPLEVQIKVHYPDENTQSERPTIRMVDSKDSWGATPPRAYFQQREEETPPGYISPLEEEQFTALTISDASPGDRTLTSRRESASTSSESYAADIDDSHHTTTSSNPQESVCGDDSVQERNEENPPPFEQTSPFAKLKAPPAIPPGESWMWSWVSKSAETPLAVTPTQSTSSDASSLVETRKLGRQRSIKTEYLPKNVALENSWRSLHATPPSQGIAMSGWLAFGLGEGIVKHLTVEGKDLNREDVAHVVLPNGSEKLWISKPDGKFEAVDLSDCRVEVKEISRQHGRALYLKQVHSGETLCTLLPVSLPEGYDGDEKTFGDGSICFPRGDYLPDDQQYTAMHIMFALDALLKAKKSMMY